MSISIHWRLMFRVNDRRALDRCLSRTLPLFKGDVEVGECKPYWKIPGYWECNLMSPRGDGSTAEQILACLLIAMSLATGWYIVGPFSAESAEGFSGVFNIKGHGTPSGPAVGLEWASFDFVTTESAEPGAAADRGNGDGLPGH
jgi:hypothetical protein